MFTHKRQVNFSEVTSTGHADIARIADYYQDCGFFQSDSVGGGVDALAEKNRAWLLAAYQIVVKRYPMYGEKLEVSTWPYGFDRVFGYRNFDIVDEQGERIAMANSYWFVADLAGGHPVRLTPEITAAYSCDPKLEMEYLPRKLDFKEEMAPAEPFRVMHAYIDKNMHMNNAWYIRMGLEYVPADFEVSQVRIEYKLAAKEGEIVYPYIAHDEESFRIKMTNEAGQIYTTLEFKGNKKDGKTND